MRHAAFFFFRRLGGRDLDALVNLHRIAIDHFAVAEAQGERDAELGFARGGRSDDRVNRFFIFRVQDFFNSFVKLKAKSSSTIILSP
jgi:hypothetical protein